MHIKEEREIRRKLKIFQHAKEINNVCKVTNSDDC